MKEKIELNSEAITLRKEFGEDANSPIDIFSLIHNNDDLTIVFYPMRKPRCQTLSYYNSRVIKDFDEFKKISDVIVANRLSDEIKDVVDKVYTRDLFSRD